MIKPTRRTRLISESSHWYADISQTISYNPDKAKQMLSEIGYNGTQQVFDAGQKKIRVLGPFEELADESVEVHKGF